MELAAKEAELTKEVPNLLETMNRTSEEVNLFERKASEAQERYKKLLEQWSRLYEELRSHYGQNFERVKPYFEASAAFRSASERVQVVVREFSAAASQYSQAKAELRNIERMLAYGAHKADAAVESAAASPKFQVRITCLAQLSASFGLPSCERFSSLPQAGRELVGSGPGRV
ncbi:unnamed protein product [Effrenium voratum]|uniref:Uncharacterized protein n=1 Tax=Effrenium voratum TaxID=2562239 RepID=A0AA36MM43_9DINO|nr:unnamed protein product [Effrenium voratum]